MTGPAIHDHDADTTWMTDADCRGVDPDLWFADKGDLHLVRQAITICHTCPVEQACLDYALATNQTHGVWGGATVKERRKLRRQRGLNTRTFFQPEENTA